MQRLVEKNESATINKCMGQRTPPPCPLKPHGTMKETSNRKSNLSVSGYRSTGNHMLL